MKTLRIFLSSMMALLVFTTNAPPSRADDWEDRYEDYREELEDRREEARERWEDYQEDREDRWDDHRDRRNHRYNRHYFRYRVPYRSRSYYTYRPDIDYHRVEPHYPRSNNRYYDRYDDGTVYYSAPPRYYYDDYYYRPRSTYYGTPRYGYYETPYVTEGVRVGPFQFEWPD